MSKSLNVGDVAPDFSLPSASGEQVSLQSLLGKGPVVIFFYPKDETSGCTAQACSFRDAYEDFKKVGAEVVGISSDSVKSHESFASNHRLPYLLLSDEGAKVRKLFGVPSSLGILPGRVTYVLNQQGKVLHLFNSQLNVKKHVDEALKVLKPT